MSQSIMTYASPKAPLNTVSDIVRRALLWAVLCSVSAAPSFFWALSTYNHAAMLLGIGLFTVFYTVFTSTPQFLRFREKPFVRRTLYIGYTTRICLSIIFPLGLGLDLVPGLISIEIVRAILGSNPDQDFLFTFLITLTQGTILNTILSVYMLFLWGIQCALCKPPEIRGFPVQFGDMRPPG